jgi:hypothetical protein
LVYFINRIERGKQFVNLHNFQGRLWVIIPTAAHFKTGKINPAPQYSDANIRYLFCATKDALRRRLECLRDGLRQAGGVSLANGVADQIGSTFKIEFGPYIGVVTMDRSDTDTKVIRDLPIGISLGNQLKHLSFAGRKSIGYGFMIASAYCDDGIRECAGQCFG